MLTEDQWARLLAVPDDERAMVRHYTLSRDDLDIVTLRRTAHTRLGCAILLCYLHHPGRIPGPDERPPIALLAFVARQVAPSPTISSPTVDVTRTGASRLPRSWHGPATVPLIEPSFATLPPG
ncbi:TnpA family transposase [Azospirillum doebereinerae]